jgi:putative tryptophan/tyrosine transport system substrate-binding protein
MQRREFIGGLGAAASSPLWPLGVTAQQRVLPVVGFLGAGSPNPTSPLVTSFRRGLAEGGFIEGQNVAIEYRWADNDLNKLPRLATDLVRRGAAVIVAVGSPISVHAARTATSIIPIVFATAVDPVKYGFVDSFNKPNGTMTGISSLTSVLAGKQLNLLLELVPQTTAVAYLSGPSSAPVFKDLRDNMLAAAQALGRRLVVLEARSVIDLDAAFATLVEQHAGALVVSAFTILEEPLSRQKIIELAARHKVPTMYPSPIYPLDGGLMSYSADLVRVYHQLGHDYVARVLKGTKPADLPVQQPTKFELLINLKTANALGLTIPETLLATADEVIQ